MIKEIIPKMLWYKSSYGLDPSICSKIIKRDLFITQINNIKDLEIHFGEDAAVIYPMILKACNIAVIKKVIIFTDKGRTMFCLGILRIHIIMIRCINYIHISEMFLVCHSTRNSLLNN